MLGSLVLSDSHCSLSMGAVPSMGTRIVIFHLPLPIHRIGIRSIDGPISDTILIQKKSYTNFLKSIRRCSVL